MSTRNQVQSAENAVDNTKESDPKPALEIEKIYTSPIVKVKVGTDAKEYLLHKEALIHHSGFFQGALGSSTFKEAEDGIVVLEDVGSEIFDTFVHSIYYAPVPIPLGDPNDVGTTGLRTHSIIHSYVFADKYLVPVMEKQVMDAAVIRFSERAPWYNDVTYAFDNLPSNSPFLTLLVDSQSELFDQIDDPNSETLEDIENLPSLFLYRTLVRRKEVSQSGGSAIRPRDFYNKGTNHNITDSLAKKDVTGRV